VSQHPLLALSSDREVRQSKGFRKVAADLSGEGLREQYEQEKSGAPNRRDAGKRFLQPHSGAPPTERRKSQDVLHIGAALVRWCAENPGGLPLPEEGRIDFFDYGIPLKTAAADRSLGDADPNKGVEKVDLIGIGPDDRMALGFVKYLEPDATRAGTGDTPLRALLHALAHTAFGEANRGALQEEVEAAHGHKWSDAPPVLMLIASPRYWELCRKREAQRGAGWIHEMERIAREVEEHIRIQINFLSLKLEGNPGWEYGEDGPVLTDRPRFDRAWEHGAGRVRPRAKPRLKTQSLEPEIVEADLDRAVRGYGISESYQPGDRIDHPTLGMGVVQRVVSPGKVEVLFGERQSLLVHERPRPSASP
jgi:hypothetical protein